jgi:membrane protease YdiL (CAAX protease family)
VAVALGEELVFRGLVLCALVRAWGRSRRGLVGSALFASLLFAVVHLTQVFTYGVSYWSAVVLTVETFIIATGPSRRNGSAVEVAVVAKDVAPDLLHPLGLQFLDYLLQ